MVRKLKIEPEMGFHNQDIDKSISRLVRGQTYKDLSTIWITPTRGSIKPKVVSSWLGLQKPMNQQFFGPLFVENDEVGNAYQKAFEMVLDHSELSKWKYILTVEEDNLPPSDGLLKLYESITDYDCVGGLYWTKGESGQPMIYGDPGVMPRNFIPQVPRPDTVQHCNGLGWGSIFGRLICLRNSPDRGLKPCRKRVRRLRRICGSTIMQAQQVLNLRATRGLRSDI